jgi:tyrosinase
MGVRKNQAALTAAEWKALISAMAKIHAVGEPLPRYADFVKVHRRAMDPSDMEGMSWHVHSMNGMDGFNFLSWHRYFVLQMERRLQKDDPSVNIPYWDATNSPHIPPPMATKKFIKDFSIRRGKWDPSQLATPAEETDILQTPTFRQFQRALEGHIHAGVHNAVGGDMASASSPSDPLFWLHHANIDRLWANWQSMPAHNGLGPSNPTDKLKPPPIFDVTVAQVQSVAALNYSYA